MAKPAAQKESDKPVAPKAPDKSGAKIPTIFVRAVPEKGFRRAGLHFTRDGVRIALSALTDEQIKALRAESQLIVEDAEFDVYEDGVNTKSEEQ
jgi:hypothetical protein